MVRRHVMEGVDVVYMARTTMNGVVHDSGRQLLSDVTFYISILFFFFFNDTATTEIYTLSLHDALPIS